MSIKSKVVVTAAVLLLGAGAAGSFAQQASASPRTVGAAGEQFTGLAARVLTRPSAVRATDGRYHIVYELVLTDMTSFAVNVDRVDVRDARTHRVVQSLSGRVLSSRMNPLGTPRESSLPMRRCSPRRARRSSGSTSDCETRETSRPC